MNTDRKRIFRWAALLSYIPAFIYIHWYVAPALEYDRLLNERWGNLLFTVLFIAVVECFADRLGLSHKELTRQTARDGRAVSGSSFESIFFAGSAVLMSLITDMLSGGDD